LDEPTCPAFTSLRSPSIKAKHDSGEFKAMEWTNKDIARFVTDKTKESFERTVEGPALLGSHFVWRVWTNDGQEFNAHYVVGNELLKELTLFENFQPFAIWLTKAFNATDSHARKLDWLRSMVATIITLTLLALVVWAVTKGQVTSVNFQWLVGALATTALGYLLGGKVKMSK
jgi:hypothetical protein